MRVKYIYSACLEIECSGFTILTDPWFTPGAYDGSWFHYEDVDPFEVLSKPDVIYISHIHPDHYDPVFLRKALEKWGDIPILIPDLNPNYLVFKGKSDNLNLLPTRHWDNDRISLFIEENDTGSASDIDSALLVVEKSTGKAVLNLNDCIYNPEQNQAIHSILERENATLELLALGYTGAGPFPQTYFDPETDIGPLKAAAEKKKTDFFDRYRQFTAEFPAKHNLPFAGEYLLGGHLARLNPFRGVADAYEIAQFDSRAVVLSVGGFVDLGRGTIEGRRDSPLCPEKTDNRVREISVEKMDYEKESSLPFGKINFMRLLLAAVAKASRKSEVISPYTLVFTLLDLDEVCGRYSIDLQEHTVKPISASDTVSWEQPYSEITIDYRYFFGLLTGIYHWNNAETGSQFFTRREPIDNYERSVKRYLNFLCAV